MPGLQTAEPLTGSDPPATTLGFEASSPGVGFPWGCVRVRGVDLPVSASEIVGVVGESGSGKSVLGLAALGLLPPDGAVSGCARLAGNRHGRGAPRAAKAGPGAHAAAVFQDPAASLNPTKRVGAQLMEVCASGGIARDRLAEVSVPEPARALSLREKDINTMTTVTRLLSRIEP